MRVHVGYTCTMYMYMVKLYSSFPKNDYVPGAVTVLTPKFLISNRMKTNNLNLHFHMS